MADKAMNWKKIEDGDGRNPDTARQDLNETSEMLEIEDSSENREQWQSSTHFFLTVLGFCVGLGNIWRFPYLCQEHGGGAFIIPFLVMVVVEGMPLMLLELGIGQKFRKGSLGAWNSIHPWIGGIGIGSTIISLVVGSYYNVIIAWCLFYLFKSVSFTSLPWSSCPTWDNGTVIPECDMSSETQYFWYREALDISDSILSLDGIKWWMLLALVTSWLVVYLIIMKGVHSSGKIVYFTALFPYVVLTIFLIRGLTLKGSLNGLFHMFQPNWTKLQNPKIWLDAATQVFYSFGIAFGSIISFGSYNHSKRNCVKDVVIICICNTFTAVYACAVVFAILGFKAQHLFDACKEWNRDSLAFHGYEDLEMVDDWRYFQKIQEIRAQLPSLIQIRDCNLAEELDQAAQGTGLAFIVMADVFTVLPGSPFWSFLFFSMLLALGLGSQIGIMEGVLGTLFDMTSLKWVPRPILSGLACFICFALGLLFVTGAGVYWLSLFDSYGAQGLTIIALAETLAVMYVYGGDRFLQDIHKMAGVQLGMYWKLMWKVLAPLLLFVVLLATLYKEIISLPTYKTWYRDQAKVEELPYPPVCLYIALVLAILSVLAIVVTCLLRCTRSILSSKSNVEV